MQNRRPPFTNEKMKVESILCSVLTRDFQFCFLHSICTRVRLGGWGIVEDCEMEGRGLELN